jgi:hypothetical protein
MQNVKIKKSANKIKSSFNQINVFMYLVVVNVNVYSMHCALSLLIFFVDFLV